MTFLRKHWRWVAAGLAVILVSVGASFLPLADWSESLSRWVETLGPFGVVAFVLVYALATVLLLPGSVLTVAAGAIFGIGLGTFAAWCGAVLGSSLAFLVGRHLARAKVEERTKHDARFGAIDEAIGKQGWKMIGLLRLSPLIPFNVSNYFYGITRVGFWPYCFATAAGILPGTLLYSYLGAAGKLGLSGGARERSPMELVLFGVGFVVTIGVAIWVSRIAKRTLEKSGATKGDAKK